MKNIDNIKISKAIPDDAEGIQILTAESSKGMYALCGWSPEEISNHFPIEKIKEGAERLRKLIPTFTEDDIMFVAKDEENKIIGCCLAEKQKNINKIEAVYISPEFQGFGLGKKLYDTAYGLLNHNNHTFLDVFSLNSKAINFYKKLGFLETGKKTFDKRFKDSKGNILEISEMMLVGQK
jgi:ribosomal protein S18 acetylase RimI-like enzyme